MPTYEYRCPKGHEFELFQKMSDEPVASCPECGEAAQRLLSPGGGFVFKGEGFYITDYKRKDEARKAERTGGGEKAPEGGAGKAAEGGAGSGAEAGGKEPAGGASGTKAGAGGGASSEEP